MKIDNSTKVHRLRGWPLTTESTLMSSRDNESYRCIESNTRDRRSNENNENSY